jgi:heterodisulfide reductase subunit B
MRYAYYPGCSLESTARDYDISARAVCRALDIELHEIPDWICCGASSAHMTSELLSLALPAKNLLLAREMGLDIAVCCAACYNRLKVANIAMRSEASDRVLQVDEIVGGRYRGETRILHLLEIIVREYGLAALQEKVNRDLSDLRVAAYYGCLLLRPPEAVRFDDPENPTAMENLVAALGAQTVDWPYRTECCGASLSLTRTDVVLKLCRDILQMAADQGAACLMVACPLCHMNLDMRQKQVNKRYKTNFALPVFYFTQVIGLALDLEFRELGLEKLAVKPKKFLKAVSLAQ